MLIALGIAALLEEAGAELIGPANTVEQAHALLAQWPSDLHAALLDLNVAGVSVDSAILALKERGVPFACMTGYGPGDASGPDPGAPVIAKPFPPEQIVATVKSLLAG